MHLHFVFVGGAECPHAVLKEAAGVDFVTIRRASQRHAQRQIWKVVRSLAGTEVDADTRRVGAAQLQQAGIGERLLGGSGGELAVDAGMLPAALHRVHRIEIRMPLDEDPQLPAGELDRVFVQFLIVSGLELNHLCAL